MADYLGYKRAFDRAGIPVSFEPGWDQRGHGDIGGAGANSIKFIVLHHTAGSLNDAGQINVVKNGTNGLQGPLSQIVLKHGDGLPHVIASGVSWHAFGEISFRGVPAGSGNYHSIGIEAVSSGLRDDWSKAQRENYPKVVAALLVDLGLDEKAWIFHRDYQPNSKIDPAFWTAKQMQDGVSYWYHKIKGGTAAAPVKTAIEDLADKLKLGKAMTDERTCPDGIGKNRVYQDGKTIVYWTPQTPAAAVGGENLKKYSQIGYEKSVLGYPITSEVKIRDNGTYQRFQKGNMYYTPKYGSKLVYGAIFNKWGELDYEKGSLGYPITDELTASDGKGRYNEFEFGTVYWSAKTGAHEVHGLIRDAFKEAGGLEKVGYPTTGEREVPNKTGKYNHFENGSIYWKKGQKKAFFVPKWVVNVWANLGWENSVLGYPINHVETIDGIEQQGFEAGTIGYNKEKDQTLIRINGVWEPVIKAPLVTTPQKPKIEAKVGELFIDYSAMIPAAKDVKAKDFVGAMRYISPARESWMKGKPLSKKELDDYKTNGMQVGFIWQNLKNDWTAGYVGGVADARAAQKKMEELGYPEAVIYCAIDNNLAQQSKEALGVWNKTAGEYVKGFQSVLGRDRVGVYANYFVISWAIEDGYGRYYWQHNWTNTNSETGELERRIHPEAHLHQYEIDIKGVLPESIDRNRVLKPYFGQV